VFEGCVVFFDPVIIIVFFNGSRFSNFIEEIVTKFDDSCDSG
jgi:hypothetical protein